MIPSILTLPIQIISPTPGLNTTERILILIQNHPQGITVKELSHALNRPVSMINHCLKVLVALRKIEAKRTLSPSQWIYYPISTPQN